jgi:hypothetical protein
MIPREILKKIRQMEIRTNRIVTETLTRVMNAKSQMLNREIRQIHENGFGDICSRISWGSRLGLF